MPTAQHVPGCPPHPPQVRLADPTWVGFCHSRGIECGELPAGGTKRGKHYPAAIGATLQQAVASQHLPAQHLGTLMSRVPSPNTTHHPSAGARVVAKAYPEEKVGVFARRGGALEVVEYSGEAGLTVGEAGWTVAAMCCRLVVPAAAVGSPCCSSPTPHLPAPFPPRLNTPELDPSEACASDPATGELKYGWSNVCLHYFRRDWLEAVSGRLADMGRYHIARKKIPSKDGPVAVRGGVGQSRGGVCAGWWVVGWVVHAGLCVVSVRQQPWEQLPPCPAPPASHALQGVKLELFIFDTFPLANSTALLEVRPGTDVGWMSRGVASGCCRPPAWKPTTLASCLVIPSHPLPSPLAVQVRREEEFAPVKNAPGQGLPDSPDTAREAILALHRRWVHGPGEVECRQGWPALCPWQRELHGLSLEAVWGWVHCSPTLLPGTLPAVAGWRRRAGASQQERAWSCPLWCRMPGRAWRSCARARSLPRPTTCTCRQVKQHTRTLWSRTPAPVLRAVGLWSCPGCAAVRLDGPSCHPRL